MPRSRIPLLDRLLSRRNITERGCWEYTGSLINAGYGMTYDATKKKYVKVCIYFYEHTVGPVPIGKILDHVCMNRACFNPAHLEPVTFRENVLRGTGPTAINARKTSCHNGHPYVEGSFKYELGDVGRRCLICQRERTKRYWIAERERRNKRRAAHLISG